MLWKTITKELETIYVKLVQCLCVQNSFAGYELEGNLGLEMSRLLKQREAVGNCQALQLLVLILSLVQVHYVRDLDTWYVPLNRFGRM